MFSILYLRIQTSQKPRCINMGNSFCKGRVLLMINIVQVQFNIQGTADLLQSLCLVFQSISDEVSLKLSEMYKKELQLKKTIVEEIAHSADQDLMMVYLSSWLYQPYIDNSSKLLLEAMLLETGHRPCQNFKCCLPCF